MKIELEIKQILGYIILGIKNKQYQATINLAQDCINEMDTRSEYTQLLDPYRGNNKIENNKEHED